MEGYPLGVEHKQNWDQGFILLTTSGCSLSGLEAGSDDVEPASDFMI